MIKEKINNHCVSCSIIVISIGKYGWEEEAVGYKMIIVLPIYINLLSFYEITFFLILSSTKDIEYYFASKQC